MNTIQQAALESDVKSSADRNPDIGVSDNHLLVSSRPTISDTFTADSGALPTVPARWFRITNASGSDVTVTKRTTLLSKYFDGNALGVLRDSGSILLSNPAIDTPNGVSRVLKIQHTDDNSAYAVIPSPYGLQVGHTLSCYFKVGSNTDELQPLGIYSTYGAIDTNFPAVGLRLSRVPDQPTNNIMIRVGDTEIDTMVGFADDNFPIWHKAQIDITSGTTADVSVHRYDSTAKTWSEIVNQSVTSDGYALLGGATGLLAQSDYVVAFAAEGSGVQYIDNFEILAAQASGEILLTGTTKEYDCRRSLYEYSVDGSVTGYYRG